MVDVALSAGRLLLAFVLVFLNGFFVAAEFAYVRIRPSTVETLAEDGRAGSALLEEAMDSLDDYLAVTQLGITIASLGLGWVGEPAVAALIEPVLEPILPAGLLHFVAFALGFGFITFLHVVFGELAPKTIAIARAEQIALLVAPPMRLFYYLFLPGIIVFNGTANFFTRLIGVPPASESEESMTEEELLAVMARSGRQGHIDMAELEMIERVFDLDDVTVREVMVPRPDVVSVPTDLPIADLRERIAEAEHTRYPVVDVENGDQVVGFVDVKDVLRVSLEHEPTAETVGDITREILIVPETERVVDLLSKFQAEQRQIGAVIDEWGTFEGIVTVEDVVEVVVGDIRDEFDVEDGEPSIHREDGTFVIDGGVTIATVNEALTTEFETAGFETIGGLVLDRLGRAPEDGDSITVEGYRLTVGEVDGTRISTVIVREIDEDQERTDGDQESDGEQPDGERETGE